MDGMIAVGLARFGLDLDLPERRVQALFEDGCTLPLAQSTVSRLSVEFLVRWRMLCEARLPKVVRALGGLVAQFDGTGEPSGGKRVTYRAREGRHGFTLWSDPLVSESEDEVARQDPEEVARRIEALPKEGRRPSVELKKGREEEQLEGFLRALRGPGPFDSEVMAWAISVGCEPQGEVTPQ